MSLPDKLFKPQSPSAQLKRAQRIIGILGSVNIILLALFIGTVAMTRYENNRMTARLRDSAYNPPVTVTMPIKAFGDDRLLEPTDTVKTPFVTIYGKVENYDAIRYALKNFTVTVKSTTVVLNSNSGEFAEKLILEPGENAIPIAVSWEGVERYRNSYRIAFEPPVDATSTPAVPTP